MKSKLIYDGPQKTFGWYSKRAMNWSKGSLDSLRSAA